MLLGNDFAPPLRTLTAKLFGLAALFAILSYLTTTIGNDFPATYHPDEPSKARQVIEGDFNFHHPMLMLSTVRALVAVTNTEESVHAVTVVGRHASALFTSGAVLALCLVAGLLYGRLAALFSGVLLVTNHHLFELAHYFKEDPAVLFGISIFFLALVVFDGKPGLPGALAVGAGIGLAVSGKYVGVIVVPFALAVFRAHHRTLSTAFSTAAAVAAAIVVFAVVNFPILSDPNGFLSGFEREIGFAIDGHKGITRSVPHGVYGAVFRESTNPVIWILLGVFVVGLIPRLRRVPASEWAFAIFPLLFAVVLSFSPKTHHRYFLPATGILLVLAAAGAMTLAHLRWKQRPIFPWAPQWVLPVVAILASLAVQAPNSWAYLAGFSNDSRSRLGEYLRVNATPTETLVQDKRADLRSLSLPNPIEGKLFAADVGTVQELRSRGIRYVAVTEGDYGRFFRNKLRPTDQGAEEYQRRRLFYEELFESADLVLEIPPGTLQYLQPHIRLYKLDRDGSGN